MAGRSKGRRLGLSDARLLAVGGLLLFAWLGAGARLFYVQVVESDRWAAESLEQRLTRKELAARRGTIFDTRGREMAVTIDGTTIYANPKQIESAEVAARLLGAVLDRPTSVILERLREDSTFVYLARQLEFDQAEEVRALDLAGIYTLSEPEARLPGGCSRQPHPWMGRHRQPGQGGAGVPLRRSAQREAPVQPSSRPTRPAASSPRVAIRWSPPTRVTTW